MNAKTILSVLVVTMLLGSAGLAEEAPKAASDLCKDAVDPYNPVSERGRFFTAAGVDNEIDAQEFETNRTHRDPFVRRFDQWAGILQFDKNDSKTIDWFEADAYRQDIRKRILGAYDENRDARLKGTEREAANRALSEGKVPAAGKLPSIPGTVIARRPRRQRGGTVIAGRPRRERAGTVIAGSGEGERPPVFRADYRKLYKEYDKDGDGRMSREEYLALAAAVKDERKKWELEHYDTNGDGTVDDGERKAAEEARKRYYAQIRERWTVRRWDRNKDGRLDEEELAAKKAQEDQSRRRAEEARRKYMEQWDTDRDGNISDEEQKAMADHYRRLREERRKKMLERWDTDKDGTISQEERKAMYTESRKRYEERRKAMDADGDGKVTTAEYQVYQKKLIEKYDADGDGQLNEDERRKRNEETGGGWYGGGFLSSPRRGPPGIIGVSGPAIIRRGEGGTETNE